MVTITKYKKIKIDHAIYIKFFSDTTVYCIAVSTDDFLNTNNNETKSPELRIFFEEHFDIKVQEGSVLN